MKKSIIFIIVVLALIAAGYYLKPYLYQPQPDRSELKRVEMNEIFDEESFLSSYGSPFTIFNHSFDDSTYAFVGSSLIDIEGDGIEEIFLAGGLGQSDALIKFTDEGFIDIIEGSGLDTDSPTAGGAISLDINKDKSVDLLVAREDGIYIYLNKKGVFTESKVDIKFEQDTVPMSLAAGDINKDGWVDLYISTFKSAKKLKLATFNDPDNLSHNVLLLNNGDNTFTNITSIAGVEYNQNTFQASFVDFNNDTWVDLVLSPNTDKVVVYENMKDSTFEKKAPLTEYGFWMGMTIADIDNDLDQDLFFSNAGNTIPEKAARGDLRKDQILELEWALLRNDGDFNFTNITEEYQLTNYEFAWGALLEDLNLDGKKDLLVSENYIKWPAHKIKKLSGRILLQGDNQYIPAISALSLENPYYGTTPLTSDFNNDGQLDIVWVNLNGSTRVFLSKYSEEKTNHFLKVLLPDATSSLGAQVNLYLSDGSMQSMQKIVGQGLMTDTSSTLHFGIPANLSIKKLEVQWQDGSIKDFTDLDVDSQIKL